MFKTHKEIPNKYRRVIIDETLTTRVSKIPLATCNEIIQKHIEEETENESLKDFKVEWLKNGKRGERFVQGRQNALIECDHILEFGECKDPTVVIAVSQAKRLINGYLNGTWIFPESKDKIRFVSRDCA